MIDSIQLPMLALAALGGSVGGGDMPEVIAVPVLTDDTSLIREPVPLGTAEEWLPTKTLLGPFPTDVSGSDYAELRIEIGTDGMPIRCQSDSKGERARIACDALIKNAKFIPALGRDGRAKASVSVWMVHYSATQLPRIPSLPPSGPRTIAVDRELLDPGANLLLYGSPDLPEADDAPQGRDLEMVASVRSFVDDFGARRLGCHVLIGTSDVALDQRVCTALEKSDFRPFHKKQLGRATVMVRWTRGKASIVLPSGAGSDVSVDPKRWALPQKLIPEGSNKGFARIEFHPSGSAIRCKIVESTGSDAADASICRHYERLKYRPAVDIFGRNRPGLLTVRLVRS